ncbi:MAG: restriction system protein [Clostridia bacterium]|jgi:restriction system protein|nr:restriction endonuclease [Clostridiales bacterium]MDK2986743.1 restriction system protein [Clostridia bacterium]
MVKQVAKGGFVVTTSDITPNAREYAEGLNIELINGNELIEMWISVLQEEVKESWEVIPKEAY